MLIGNGMVNIQDKEDVYDPSFYVILCPLNHTCIQHRLELQRSCSKQANGYHSLYGLPQIHTLAPSASNQTLQYVHYFLLRIHFMY